MVELLAIALVIIILPFGIFFDYKKKVVWEYKRRSWYVAYIAIYKGYRVNIARNRETKVIFIRINNKVGNIVFRSSDISTFKSIQHAKQTAIQNIDNMLRNKRL